MAVSEWGYFVFLALVACERLWELRFSSRNQRRMAENGVPQIAEPHYSWIVAAHTGVLIGAGLEVWLLHRPFLPWLAAPMILLLVLAALLRVWVIRAMSGHWSMRLMDSTQLGVVTGGPYRWVRHPNYVAVVAEIISIPMIHTAWISAIYGVVVYTAALRGRLKAEEGALNSSVVYRTAMGSKPRFIPRFF